LSDFLEDKAIKCHVLSPTQLPKSAKSARQKTDAKDALMLLEQVRGFVLGGNRLPVVWTPPQRLRDDRELVRARIDTADAATRIKLQILSMLKRYGLEKPSNYRPPCRRRSSLGRAKRRPAWTRLWRRWCRT
jgi:transposase